MIANSYAALWGALGAAVIAVGDSLARIFQAQGGIVRCESRSSSVSSFFCAFVFSSCWSMACLVLFTYLFVSLLFQQLSD